MITIPGTLAVKTIKGSRGLFAVGELQSTVGTFKVKDQILDQFEPGRYEGEFLVSRIYPSSYIYGGRAVIEVRAEIQQVFLKSHDDTPVPDSPVAEPDPLDELAADKPDAHKSVPPAPAEAAKPRQIGDSKTTSNVGQDMSDDQLLAELFGAELWTLMKTGEPIKLDPTIDRAKFRQQRDSLKNAAYRFDASSQIWYPT